MIIVSILKCNGMLKEFRVTGHAGYDEYGQDIVCSAVTAIVYTVLGSFGELAGIHDFKDIQNGDTNDYIDFRLPDAMTEKQMTIADTLMKTLLIGLKQIENEYSAFLKVRVQEVKKNVKD